MYFEERRVYKEFRFFEPAELQLPRVGNRLGRAEGRLQVG